MADFVKTTLIKVENETAWQLVEDRVPISDDLSLRDRQIEFALVFAQEKRRTRTGYAYYAGTNTDYGLLVIREYRCLAS